MIFAVRTTSGREKQVIDRLASRIKNEVLEINAILYPSNIKGYFFIEASDKEVVQKAIYGIPHARGLIEGEVTIDQVKHFLSPVAQKITLKKNDIVELISGPFKGEKAKISRIIAVKEQVDVQLLEAAVPIPVRVNMNSIRLIERKEGEAEE